MFEAQQAQVLFLCSPKGPHRLQAHTASRSTPPPGPHSLLGNGYGCSYPGANRPRLEVHHATPCSAEGKWCYTFTPTCNDDDDGDDNNNNIRFDVIILVF